jgi:hypothetical protein
VNIDVLREEISIQLELMEGTLREIELLQMDLGSRKPTTREVAAAAAFLADFYTGVENILKRISRCYGVAMPLGEDWHMELFNRFCEPEFYGLPIIFDHQQKKVFAAYRSFRHVMHHGYAMQLDWERMAEGVKQVNAAYTPFRAKLQALFGV